jgi:hypothetical protein
VASPDRAVATGSTSRRSATAAGNRAARALLHVGAADGSADLLLQAVEEVEAAFGAGDPTFGMSCDGWRGGLRRPSHPVLRTMANNVSKTGFENHAESLSSSSVEMLEHN